MLKFGAGGLTAEIGGRGGVIELAGGGGGVVLEADGKAVLVAKLDGAGSEVDGAGRVLLLGLGDKGGLLFEID